MKTSRYNSVYVLPDHKTEKLIFNARTLAMALIENDKLDQYNSFSEKNIPIEDEKFIEDLKAGGFLIDDDVDEESIIRHEQLCARYDNTRMGLVIAPTSNCNFRCVYCYERKVLRTSMMTEETQDAIIDAVKAAANHLEMLSVTWYGGEPLLAVDIIERLSKKFLEICEENNIQYAASIVTNGYLLNRDVVKKLNELKVSRYQITLDGKKEIHDANRPLANGGGTYDIITRNIIDVKDDIPGISLRINTGRHNVQDVKDIFDWVRENHLEDKVFPYLGKITNTDDDDPITSICLTEDEFVRARLNLIRNGTDKFEDVFSVYPNPVRTYCGADRNNVFVIDSDGELYKCWDDIGHLELSVGNIKNGLTLNKTFVSYMSYCAFDDEDCRDCPVLPICMGGCPHRRVFNLPDRCSEFKEHLEEFLKITAEKIISERESRKSNESK